MKNKQIPHYRDICVYMLSDGHTPLFNTEKTVKKLKFGFILMKISFWRFSDRIF
jgi:hypothetical protein